jgi:predicted nucleotide-binding protein
LPNAETSTSPYSALGRERVFLVVKKGTELPTDLAGVTSADFESGDEPNVVAALGPATTKLELAMGLM